MAKIAIIGSGFVGQATGRGFAKRGHQVVFCDSDERIVRELKGEGYVAYPPYLLEREDGFDFFFLSVPTPTVNRQVDLGCIRNAVVALGQGVLKTNGKYSVVVSRSTIPAGTTEGLIIPMLQEQSFQLAGEDFGVCFNPEYLREKHSQRDFDDPRMIMIGQFDQSSGEALEGLYRASGFICQIFRRSLSEAELHKVLHNAANAAKISMVNEFHMICERAGIDPQNILPLIPQSAESCWNPDYGFRFFKHFGGSCLPKDIVGLATWAKNLGLDTPLVSAAIEVNLKMIRNNGGLRSLPQKEAVY